MTLKEVALTTLEALSEELGEEWLTNFPGGIPTAKTPSAFRVNETIQDLTQRYYEARRAYETEKYLECIEIATAP